MRKVSFTLNPGVVAITDGRKAVSLLGGHMLSVKNLSFSLSLSFFRKKSPHSSFRTSFMRESRMKGEETI